MKFVNHSFLAALGSYLVGDQFMITGYLANGDVRNDYI